MQIAVLKNLCVRLLVSFASVLLVGVLLEIGLRFWGGKLSNLYAVPIGWILDDPEWQIDPDLIFVREKVLEDIETEATQSSKVKLIVALGDSFTQGFPVAEDAGFTSQLHQELLKRDINTRILNVGISGYCPDQEITLLKRILEKGIRPSIVVWSFYTNDLFENGQQPTFILDLSGALQPISGTLDFVYQRQLFFEAIPLPLGIKKQSALVSSLMHLYNLKIGQQVAPEYRAYNSNFKWANKKIKLEIELAQQLAAQYNFEIVPVLIDSQTLYYAVQDFPQLSLSMDQVTAGNQIDDNLRNERNYTRLNFNQMSEDKQYQHLFNQCLDGGREYFIKDDDIRDGLYFGFHHFNETGYRLYAQVVAQKVAPLLTSDSVRSTP